MGFFYRNRELPATQDFEEEPEVSTGFPFLDGREQPHCEPNEVALYDDQIFDWRVVNTDTNETYRKIKKVSIHLVFKDGSRGTIENVLSARQEIDFLVIRHTEDRKEVKTSVNIDQLTSSIERLDWVREDAPSEEEDASPEDSKQLDMGF
ncbi:hypothetical protein [uncultured Roseibium sp.]|uniref:hypothetical protein n=1 Tax=uncultured Roseibium sp. TaxID=1936171 RepID=UPI00260AC90C|nr:hypothetical protein [uncultured Roseibium sp.]